MIRQTCALFFLPIAYCFHLHAPCKQDHINFGCPSSSLTKPSLSTYFKTRNQIVVYASENDFVDVEFERSSPEEEESSIPENLENDVEDPDLSSLLETTTNLIEISLDSGDPRWKEARIPFCRENEYIDCKLAFTVDLEGQSYGIGVPFDTPVAIVVQEKSKKGKDSNNESMDTINIDPDAYSENEEYAELMEIFAGQVQEQLGEELRLRKTPKVLTVSGGLDKITKDWQKSVLPKPFDADDLLKMLEPKDEDEIDKELDSFYKFMRDELGDEEFEKTMNDIDDEGDIGVEFDDLMDLFDVPGFSGTDEVDKQALEELSQSITEDLKTGVVSGENTVTPDIDSAALKLLGYTFRDSGKSYFLVKPLQPYTLVGRHIKDEEDILRFDLLTPEEETVILPKLEKLCREDLEANGLDFSSKDVLAKADN